MGRNYHWDSREWHEANMRRIFEANRRAAEMGIPEAQNEMGVRSYVGSFVERNRAAALDWFGKAAAQGNADACYNLGICHAYGQQSEINYSVAVDCFKWAARLGSVEAATLLLERHDSGKWPEKNVHEVAQWYRMLCRRNTDVLKCWHARKSGIFGARKSGQPNLALAMVWLPIVCRKCAKRVCARKSGRFCVRAKVDGAPTGGTSRASEATCRDGRGGPPRPRGTRPGE